MNFNHANLCTSDVARAADFFIRHFGFARLAAPRPNFTVLRGGDGFLLNLMRPGRSAVSYPPGFHVGFYVETPDQVRTKHAELAEGGWEPGAVEDLTRGGFSITTFYCPLTDGILVEVSSPRRAAMPGSRRGIRNAVRCPPPTRSGKREPEHVPAVALRLRCDRSGRLAPTRRFRHFPYGPDV